LTPLEKKREAKVAEQAKADQTIQGEVTEADLNMAVIMDKAAKAELEDTDAEGVAALLDAGYMQITSAGTPVLLPAGKRRLEAIRKAQESPRSEPMADEVIEPIPYENKDKKARQEAIDEEIGRRMRGEEVIEPRPSRLRATLFSSGRKRKPRRRRRR
jgi:hypothetical protein